MPFALAIIGIIFMVTAIKGTTSTFFGLIKADFTGSGNYVYWVISILIVGSVGYIKKLQPVSDLFLTLILVVMMLKNQGFFAQFMSAVNSGSSNCPTSTPSAGQNVVNNQLEQTPATAAFVPGQTISTQLNNALTNINSALGNSATLYGG